MKCYICAREGKDTDAVSICIVCGMGVCCDHLVRDQVELYEGGYPFPSKKSAVPLPRMLCTWCHDAYESMK